MGQLGADESEGGGVWMRQGRVLRVKARVLDGDDGDAGTEVQRRVR